MLFSTLIGFALSLSLNVNDFSPVSVSTYNQYNSADRLTYIFEISGQNVDWVLDGTLNYSLNNEGDSSSYPLGYVSRVRPSDNHYYLQDFVFYNYDYYNLFASISFDGIAYDNYSNQNVAVSFRSPVFSFANYSDNYTFYYVLDDYQFSSQDSNYLRMTIDLFLMSESDYALLNNNTEKDVYNTGYEDGYNQGKKDGYDEANVDLESAEADGYADGYDNGYYVGYSSGVNDTLATHDFTFTNLFGSLADTPILIIRRLFGFELFGVSLIAVFMSLFTALIVIHLIKKVF